MKLLSWSSLGSLTFLLIACAEPISADGDESNDADAGDDGGPTTGGTGSGGLSATGGGSGGLIGATGGASSGGSSSGGASSGGASSGGASSGGSSSGGASSGGASTGGTTFDGECAGKPTFDEWKSGSGQSGDQVVYTCTVSQAGCSSATLNEPSLFECNQSHVPNCQSQSPRDGSSWTLLGACDDSL